MPQAVLRKLKMWDNACFVLLLSCSLALSTQLPAQTWTILDAPYGGRYDDVFFVNPALGWACNANGQIVHTLDSGATWSVQAETNNYLRSIEFINADTGFCGGLYSSGYFYKTTDGGQNWTNITSQVPGLTNSGICGLSCPGSGRVYGCGVWSTPAYLIKSTDNGQTWEKKDMSAYASALIDVFFITPDSGWVSGVATPSTDGGIILSTSDGGNTWHTRIKTGFFGDYVWKLQTPDSLHWFASIERYEIPGATTEILKSNDGGSNWSIKTVAPVSHRLQMIGFLDKWNGVTGDDYLFKTSDGGENWEQIASNSTNYNRFWRMSPSSAIVSAAELLRYSPGTTGTKDMKSEAIVEAHYLAVSPNPSSGPLHIHVDLNARTNVILKIIPVDGKAAEEVLWTGEHPAGTYDFDALLSDKWAAQTVVVWLKTDFGAQQRTITLVR